MDEEALENRTWVAAKAYIRAILADFILMNKLTAGESGFSTNSVTTKTKIEDQVRQEIVEKLEDYFDNLDMAAIASQSANDEMLDIILELTPTTSKKRFESMRTYIIVLRVETMILLNDSLIFRQLR